MATNCATLWNQKLWCGALFQYKKDQTKILQICSLKYSIKHTLVLVGWRYLGTPLIGLSYYVILLLRS